MHVCRSDVGEVAGGLAGTLDNVPTSCNGVFREMFECDVERMFKKWLPCQIMSI